MIKLIIMYLIFSPVLMIDTELESNNLLQSFQKCQTLVFSQLQEKYSRSKSKSFKNEMEQEWQIVNGTLTDISDFPYMSVVCYCMLPVTAIGCGGNIITDYHILTAAHCTTEFTITTLEQLDGPLYNVREKEYFIIQVGSSISLKGGQFLKVSEIHVHPEYNTEGLYGRDLAVLKAAEKFPMSNTVATIPVATPELSHQLEAMENSQTECVATGWGKTLNSTVPLPLISLLRTVKLTLMPIKQCIQLGRLTDFYITRKEHICTLTRHKDACRGDSGGGLVCRGEDGVQRIWGVVSFSRECAQKMIPGYYSRVDNADSFLKQFLGTQSSPVKSAATLQRAILKLLFPLVLQFASSSFRYFLLSVV